MLGSADVSYLLENFCALAMNVETRTGNVFAQHSSSLSLCSPNTPTWFRPKLQFVFAQHSNLLPNTQTWLRPKPQFVFAQHSNLLSPKTPICFRPTLQLTFAQNPNLFSPNTPTYFRTKPQFIFAQQSNLLCPKTPICFRPTFKLAFAQNPNLFSPNTPTCFLSKPQFFRPKPQIVFAQHSNLFSPKAQCVFAQHSQCCLCQLPVMTSGTVTPSIARLLVPSCAEILRLIDPKHDFTVILRSFMSHSPMATVSQSIIPESSATTL